MLQARSGGQFGERVQHRAMTIANPLGRVLDDEGAAARLVLRRDPRGAAVGTAAQGLDAAQRKHEPARRIASVRPERERDRHVERVDDITGAADANSIPRTDADQRVAHED
jgi:hypothetical protein